MAIRHDPDQHRFVLERGGREAVLTYRLRGDDHIHLVRTWVPPEHRGGGDGARLVKAGLEHAREHGLTVSTSCWFVDEFVDRNPEYRALMND